MRIDRSTLEVMLADGRHLMVEAQGPADGEVVLFHNGTPTSALMFARHIEAGAARGLRHVCYSRPGYADSTRHPGRSVADCASDVAAIADAMSIERFYVVGWSGGGPHALACAALLPHRVRAVATIASVAPRNAPGLDWLAGMGEMNLAEFGAAEAGDNELSAYLEAEGKSLASVNAAELLVALASLTSGIDRLALTDAFADYLAAAMRQGLSSGIWGWFDDDKAFCADWGFDLGQIEVPVAICQGEQDRFVPFAHGQWLAEHLPGADARLLPKEGHLSLFVEGYDGILGDLVASAQ